MSIDWAVIIEKVPEIAMVTLFIWFTLKKDSLFESFLKARDTIFFGQLETIGSSHNEEIKEITKKQAEQTAVLITLVSSSNEHTNLLKLLVDKLK